MERYRSRSNIIRASEVLHSNRHVVAWVIVDILSHANIWQSKPASHGKDNAQFRTIQTGQLRRDSQPHPYLPKPNFDFAFFLSIIILTYKIISTLSLAYHCDCISSACSFWDGLRNL